MLRLPCRLCGVHGLRDRPERLDQLGVYARPFLRWQPLDDRRVGDVKELRKGQLG